MTNFPTPLRTPKAAAFLAAAIGCLANTLVFAQPSPKPAPVPATRPVAPLTDGWEAIDQRLVFLTIQLSTVESAIEATDKALRINGYQQATRQAAADRARAGNARMDRNGGGPVPWQDFYGRTAEQFFYHPDNGITITVNSAPASNRPPQFDYIYRANEQSRQKAQDDVQKIGTKIDDLLAYRRKLEGEQSVLWAKIAFRGESSLDIPSRPLYHSDFAAAASDDAGKQSAEAAKAAVAFLIKIDAELTDAQKNLSSDQKGTFDHLLQTTTTSRAELQAKLLHLPTVAAVLTDPRNSITQFSRAAKRLEDSAQNIVDALALAAECGTTEDHAGEQIYFGQMQQNLSDYASTVATADKAIATAITNWKLKVTPSDSPAPAAAVDATNPDDIPSRLEAAKSAHEKEFAAARQALVAEIDSHLNLAADNGDLTTVQALQKVKVAAEVDGSVSDEVKDPAIIAAKKRYDRSITAANAALTQAYKNAIRDYTRARKFELAQATQNELSKLGIADTQTTYLSDLIPFSVSTFADGAWGFGNKGRVGAGDRLISVLGAPSPHGLGTHPPSNGAAVLKYQLDGKYKRITGKVALDDVVDRSNTAVIFRLVGDGRDIWRAQPIQVSRHPLAFDVDTSGVKELQLVVDCPGDHAGCQAVWLEPMLSR